MFRLIPLLLLLCLAAAPPRPSADELNQALDGLSAASSSERARAGRWLASNLRREHYPELSLRARDIDAEGGRRLVEALASSGSHLDLVVLLMGDKEVEVRALGDLAFEQLLFPWCPGAKEIPTPLAELLPNPRAGDGRRYSFDAGEDSLPARLERLDRKGGLGVALVLDPALEDLRGKKLRPALEGSSWQLLRRLAEQGLSVVGIGGWEQEWSDSNWVLCTLRGRGKLRSGVQWLRRWCLQVERGGPGARAAARSLVSTGWPVALAWLEREYLRTEDPALLAALAHAGERGSMPTCFWQPSMRKVLLEQAQANLREGGDAEGARALARCLALVGPASKGWAEFRLELLADWERLNGPAKRVRLLALGKRADSAVRARLLELLAGMDPQREAGLALELVLLSCAGPDAAGEPPLALGPAALAAIVDLACAHGREAELLGGLLSAGLVPPVPEGPWSHPPRSLFLFRWSLQRADLERAWQLLRTAEVLTAAELTAWAEALRDAALSLGRGELDARLDLEAAGHGLLARALVVAGLAPPALEIGLADHLLAGDKLSEADLLALGFLGASLRGSSVREALLARLADPDLAQQGAERGALLLAIEAVATSLKRAELERELSLWIRAVWRAVRGREHPLRSELGPQRYPAEGAGEALSLEERLSW